MIACGIEKAAAAIAVTALIAEAQRELDMRRQVYWSRVRAGKMRQDEADKVGAQAGEAPGGAIGTRTKIMAEVTAIDAAAKVVTTSKGTVSYDRLVLSPGIDFRLEEMKGYDAAAMEIMPHAWKAGPQTVLLRADETIQ